MARVVTAYMTATSESRGAFEEGWSRGGPKECPCYSVGFCSALPTNDTGYATTGGVAKLVELVEVVHDNGLFGAHMLNAHFDNKPLKEVIFRMVRPDGSGKGDGDYGKLALYDVKVVRVQPQWGNRHEFFPGDDWNTLMRTRLQPARFDWDYGSGQDKFTASYEGNPS